MSIKHDKTWQLLEALLKTLSDSSPINISFITHPIDTALVTRIKALEQIYTKSTIYSFLIKRGIYPIVLFTLVTSSIGYGVQRTYSRSTQLFIHLVGVLYPAWQSWQLIKNKKQDDTNELKSWLTYWMIFGSFQVLDHWMKLDFVSLSKKKYNLYKLFILYWAQSPHSKGADLLYRHVLQKPTNDENVANNNNNNKEEITKEYNEDDQEIVGYSYLDGYSPPNLLNSTSSDDEDSVKSNAIHIETTIEKETFPTIEPAW
ncbi:TB2/DP1, HVA22 family-domain-containing protein [Thamnidium elegans]|nr:TB2/DP1, HVA22 family-domain-containing protein [Thamnidium elegans]